MSSRDRPRRVSFPGGREVTVRAIVEADAPEIARAFERLTAESRYLRFMHHKKQLNGAALRRGVHPRPGREFAFVATIPAADGIDIVGGLVRRARRDGYEIMEGWVLAENCNARAGARARFRH
jgi:hypothetical protein